MKNYILLFVLFFTGTNFTNAQLLDVALGVAKAAGGVAPKQVVIQSAPSLERKLESLNKRLDRIEEYSKNVQEYSKTVQDLQQKEEDALWIVPDYVKYGNVVNQIFSNEKDAYKMANNLYRALSNFKISNGKQIMQYVNQLLSSISTLADQANDLRSDNTYRMPLAERQAQLNKILDRIQTVTNTINAKVSEISSSSKIVQDFFEREDNIRNSNKDNGRIFK